MPNIDEDAKAWELELARRVGQAVKDRRNALGLTAVQLADKTRDLGYPISRVAISKIETNKRAGKIDVAELLILAAALNTSPVALMHPNPSDDPSAIVKAFPCVDVTEFRAAQWFSGHQHIFTNSADAAASGQLVGDFRDDNRTLELWREISDRYERRKEASHVRPGDELSDGQRQLIESYDREIAQIRFELGIENDA